LSCGGGGGGYLSQAQCRLRGDGNRPPNSKHETPNPTKPGARVQNRVRLGAGPRVRVQGRVRFALDPGVRVQGWVRLALLWTRESESKGGPVFFYPRARVQGRVRLPLDLRVRWTPEPDPKKKDSVRFLAARAAKRL
jgi:hypothetical protein